MKKLLSLGLLALVVTVSALTIAPSTNAQTAPLTEARCEIANGRLTIRIARAEAIKTNQTKVYTSIQTRLAEIVTSAGKSEYDTTALVAAQTAFDTKLVAFTDSAAAYSAALLAAKDTTCGEGNTEFLQAITAARTALIAVRTATLDVRTTIRGDVATALKDYAAWLKDNTSTEETN